MYMGDWVNIMFPKSTHVNHKIFVKQKLESHKWPFKMRAEELRQQVVQYIGIDIPVEQSKR